MIYLDHHAATPVLPSIWNRLEDIKDEVWANPSSVHSAGQGAARHLEDSRRAIAASIFASPNDIIFTSGGTEACNAALRGLIPADFRVLVSPLEHPAISEPLTALGVQVDTFSVEHGLPGVDEIAAQLDEKSVLVCQWVNHESGVIFPIEAYAQAAAQKGARVIVDANQAVGKIPVDLRTLYCDALLFSAHKIGGLPGAGAMYLSRCQSFTTSQLGGMQERGRRAGSPGLYSIAAFAEACSAVPARLASMVEIAEKRDRLEAALVTLGARVNGADVGGQALKRVATCTNLSFKSWRAAELVIALDMAGVAVSSGPACSTGSLKHSPAVRAFYPNDDKRAESAIRLSLGPETSDDDISAAIEIFGEILSR